MAPCSLEKRSLGFDLQQEAIWHVVTQYIITSSAIEGEHLEYEQVKSSVSRHLAITFTHPFPNDHHVDCIVEMMFDALNNCQEPLTLDRPYRWHGALFPTGFSGMHRINVGSIRNDEKGPMQVVSRSAEPSEVVHFQAPVSSTLPRQLTDFLEWINEPLKNTLSSKQLWPTFGLS